VTDRSAFRIAARPRSFRYAIRGMRAVFQSQHNAWIHTAASIAVIVVGAVVGLSRLEWRVIIGAMMSRVGR